MVRFFPKKSQNTHKKMIQRDTPPREKIKRKLRPVGTNKMACFLRRPVKYLWIFFPSVFP